MASHTDSDKKVHDSMDDKTEVFEDAMEAVGTETSSRNIENVMIKSENLEENVKQIREEKLGKTERDMKVEDESKFTNSEIRAYGEKEIKAEVKEREIKENDNENEIKSEELKITEKEIKPEEPKTAEKDHKPEELILTEKEISIKEVKPEEKEVREVLEKEIVEERNIKNDMVEKTSDASPIERKSTENKADDENKAVREFQEREIPEPVFDGTEGVISPRSESSGSRVWPDRAAAIKNYVIERGVMIRKLSGQVVISDVLKRFTTKKEQGDQDEKQDKSVQAEKDGVKEDDPKGGKDWGAWSPVNLVKTGLEKIEGLASSNQGQADIESEARELVQSPYKGRIVLYTCSENPHCRAARGLLKAKGLKFVEINIDVFPGRKADLEKRMASVSVPQLFVNDTCFGGISEIRGLDEKGDFDQKVHDLLMNEATDSAPVPPSANENDFGNTGIVDDLANFVKKLRENLVIKDRFYNIRMFSKCFSGTEAVDFIAEDQLLERDEAVEFGRKLAQKHFFHHVLEENVFEDGNHLYRFMEHDPVISTKCFNFNGITNDLKPKSVTEIAAKLRGLTLAIYEAHISEDGKHVDYKAIGTSEEFVRYLKVIEDLQRVDLHDLSRDEKLAFFVNLYNMMIIHAIIFWGYPERALERRKFFGDFRYVIGGYAYSLSAIQNGILRGNQRPPYNLIRPFGPRDKRIKVALQQPEPMVHFALVSGSRSSPAIRCYSPASIDEELRLAARIYFDDGGFLIDVENKTASVSQVLRWFSVDFGKNETEVLKFVANFLEPSKSEQLLGLLSKNQLKITYHNYDWSLNL